jgi:hypothetical protein
MRLRPWIAIAVLIALAAPAAAHATAKAVIEDCQNHNRIVGSYSQKDYAAALADLPADVDEYTDCRAQIQRAQLTARSTGRSGDGSGSGSGAGGGTGTGSGTIGGGGSLGGAAGASARGTAQPGDAVGSSPLDTASDAEKATYAKAVEAGAAPVTLDGRPISASRLGGSTVNGVGDLPTPLLVLLALLAAGLVCAAGLGTRRLVHGRRTA